MNSEHPEWVSSNLVRTQFREILDHVAYGSSHVRIQRYGHPAAVIVPPEWYESHQDVTEIGKSLPGGHPSGRFHEPPASLAQARARMLWQMDHLEQSCRIGLDVSWARKYLDEAIDDYIEFTITGAVDVERNAAELAALKAETRELTDRLAAARAEVAALTCKNEGTELTKTI